MQTRIYGLIVGAILIGIVAANSATNDPATAAHANLVLAQGQPLKGNWFFTGSSSNGLACALRVRNDLPFQSGQFLPVCLVRVTNQTTNELSFVYLSMPITNLLSIELLDSQGKLVEKSVAGKMYGLPLTQKQISDWFNDQHWQIIRHGRAFGINSLSGQQIGSFSIPQTFQIHKAGEYTLHVQMQLIHNGPDSSGQFPITTLPEVTAKIQIRANDIPQTNSISN